MIFLLAFLGGFIVASGIHHWLNVRPSERLIAMQRKLIALQKESLDLYEELVQVLTVGRTIHVGGAFDLQGMPVGIAASDDEQKLSDLMDKWREQNKDNYHYLHNSHLVGTSSPVDPVLTWVERVPLNL